MLNRRSFLLGAGNLVLAQFLAGCSQSNALKVLLLQGSIPPQLIKKFSDSVKGKPIVFNPETKPQNFFDFLQEWQKQAEKDKKQQWQIPFFSKSIPPKTDLITLGDTWLASAIQQKLLKPIDPKELSNWQKLPLRWRELVRRNEKGEYDENGQIWGAPYRWGTTVIVYRKDKFSSEGLEPPQDWQDLWQEKLKHRISLLDQPRITIGLVLKMLGYSFNTQENLAKIPNLEEKLTALHQNVKFYSSDYYLQPLVLGDTWLAVGWSNDILPLLSRYSNLGVIIPPSGTALWADLWVKPASDANSSTLEQWIDFCWQTESADQITLFTNAASPIILTQPPDLPEDIKNDPLLLVDEAILQKSEFILPLSAKNQENYDCLWKKVRRSAVQC